MTMIRSFRQDPSITHQKLKKGTVRRILTYARPYRGALIAFMVTTALDALITVVSPLLLRAIPSTISSVLSSALSLIAILITMFYLSWLVSVIALALIPLFILPARRVGRRMQRLTRESMQLDAQMGS